MEAFHSVTWTARDMADIPPRHSVRVEFVPDDSTMVPWREFDGHGIIRDVYSYWGRPDKEPGERFLHDERGTWWIYDIAATLKRARADRWGIGDEARATLARKLGREPTAREMTAAAVDADFQYCRGWLTGRYSWCGIRAVILDPDGEELASDSIFGVEWDSHGPNTYAEEETAGDVVATALHEAGLTLRQRAEAWRAALREAREARAWAARDVATVGV